MYMFEKIKKFTRVWILTNWIMKVIIFVFIYSPNFSKSKINFNKNLSTRILLSVTPTIHIDKSRCVKFGEFSLNVIIVWHSIGIEEADNQYKVSRGSEHKASWIDSLVICSRLEISRTSKNFNFLRAQIPIWN